jgi:hypothetical protein
MHIVRDNGFGVTKRSRMYLSGHDLDLSLLGVDRAIEVKRHANGQARLYGWLNGVFAVVHRADRREWLITLRLRDGIEVAKAAESRSGARKYF